MASPSDEQHKQPGTTSPGNQGSRGSRGEANSGALPDNGIHDQRAPEAGAPDLRDAPAQGGGGAASDSSRSK
jgi:hypothetical protein